MARSEIGFIDQSARSNWIKLQTLVLVRWFAISGQLLALVVAQFLLGLDVPLLLCFAVVGMSIALNLISTIGYPENRRLSEFEAVGLLLFDIVQLCVLLALTGGINNPFALLVLAPMAIAASVLSNRLTFLLAFVAIVLITLLGRFHLPLQTQDGFVLEFPYIFLFGYWISIVIGIAFITLYTRRVTAELTNMSEALFATQMALAREQKLTDLGGVVAATAHELGTPLATIKLTSSELMDELSENKELLSDATLIREQADRCSAILKSMGRAGKDDVHMRAAPWQAVVQEAAEPHVNRGKQVIFHVDAKSPGAEPLVERQPEIIHGIRNIIQNAVDFADSIVTVDLGWTRNDLTLSIKDDGSGFSSVVIHRLGDPFVRQRSENQTQKSRAEYEGMGLGLFIAKTLLERSGANLSFENGSAKSESGAIVKMRWSRQMLEADAVKTAENPNLVI